MPDRAAAASGGAGALTEGGMTRVRAAAEKTGVSGATGTAGFYARANARERYSALRCFGDRVRGAGRFLGPPPRFRYGPRGAGPTTVDWGAWSGVSGAVAVSVVASLAAGLSSFDGFSSAGTGASSEIASTSSGSGDT